MKNRFNEKLKITSLPRLAVGVALLVFNWSFLVCDAAESRSFSLASQVFLLEDVSAEVQVFLRAMRFNEATEQWNVDVVLTNSGSRAFVPPVFLSIEGFSNTTAPLSADGSAGNPPKPFLLMSEGYLSSGSSLAAGGSTQPRTMVLGFMEGAGVPSLQMKVFAAAGGDATPALALTRTLNGAGQPLPNATVFERGPLGDRTLATDPDYGVVTLGGPAGDYVWKFHREGHVPVWRSQSLLRGAVQLVPNPRLVRRAAPQTAPANSTIQISNSPLVHIEINSGTFTDTANVSLTPVDGQTLPGLLPQGWSPLRAFWFESSVAPTQPVTAHLALSPTLSLTLVRWDENAVRWNVVESGLTHSGGVQALQLPSTGAYAVIVGDPAPLAPPVPVAGQPLPSSTLPPQPAPVFAASGTVSPSVSIASRIAEEVTGSASVTLSNLTGVFASGLTLRAQVTESYRLLDNSFRFTAPYETFVAGYGFGSSTLNALSSEFPMRPLLLFGPEELAEATLRLEVLAPEAFQGTVFDITGGAVADQGVRVIAEAGDIGTAQAVSLRRFNSTNVASLLVSGQSLAAGFDLIIAGVVSNQSLSLQVSNLPPSRTFVLARILSDVGLNGLEPVERLRSETNGVLTSLEPATGERLPGLRRAGQYLLVQVTAPHGLVTGIVRNSVGDPVPGAPVRINDQPWLTLSASTGAYQLVAPTGVVQVVATEITSGNSDFLDITVDDPNVPIGANLGTAPHGPRVASVSPAPGSRNVNRVAPIVVTFTEPINPGTIIGTNLQLLDSNNTPVSATVTINLRNTLATLLPANPLQSSASYTIVLSSSVSDLSGLTLEGPNQFTFQTQSAVARSDLAKLTIFEPGATNLSIGTVNVRSLLAGFEDLTDKANVVVAYGSPGTAETEAPVILVNETTGETSTVLSKPDGSFASFLTAAEDDFVSAVFINANGTRTSVPATEQRFDDGGVGLYSRGGILDAESDGGPVQVIIEPDAIHTRNVFKVEALNLSQLLTAIQGQLPLDATLLTGAKLSVKGEPANGEANVVFPFDPVAAEVSDPEKGAYSLAIAHKNDRGETVYMVVDRLKYKDGKLFSNTLPFLGFLAALAVSEAVTFAALETADFILTAIIAGKDGIPVTGVVSGLSGFDSSGQPQLKPLSGALVTLHTLDLGFRTPGRLPAGLTYATTGPDGRYAFLVPKTKVAGYALSATHPRFEEFATKPLTSFSLFDDLGAKEIDFELTKPVSGIAALKVSMFHSPLELPIGGPAHFEVTASHGEAAPQIQVAIDSVKSLTPGVIVQNSEASLINQVDTVLGKTRKLSVDVDPGTNKVQVLLEVIVAAAGSSAAAADPIIYPLAFTGERIQVNNPIEPADKNDGTGPMVVATFPSSGATLSPGHAIQIIFNEPIDATVTNTPGAVVISGPGALPPFLALSPDQQTLEVSPGRLQPGVLYSVAVNSTIKDLSGNAFDQELGTTGPQSFNLQFSAPASISTPLSSITSGAGIVLNANFAFALDRAAGKEALFVFDVKNPLSPTKVAEFRLPEFPRDLVLITNWSFVPAFGQPPSTHRHLVAVAGGLVGGASVGGEQDLVSPAGQWLRVFDVTDPAIPSRLMGAVITRRNTVVSKLRWSPPFLAYLENGSDFKQIGLIDLQEMLIGFRTAPSVVETFPPGGTPGEDNDNNGDYVSSGDVLPLPPQIVAEFFGKKESVTLENTTQHILDFDFAAGYVAVTLTGGTLLDSKGNPIGTVFPPSYRTLTFGGQEIDPAVGSVPFGQNARPKRLFTVFGLPVEVSGQIQFKIVALVSISPDDDGINRLALIDITIPTSPVLLNKITFPNNLNLGLLQSINERPDGLLELATSTDKLLLDPRKLTLPDPSGSGWHPAVTTVLPGTGSGNISLGANEAGVHVVNLGGRNEVVLTAPRLRFVQLPEQQVFDPLSPLPADPTLLLSNMLTATIIAPARFRDRNATATLDPPSPFAHYYVLVDAPGEAGPTISIGLESLNRSGYPLKNKGRNFPPVRALADGTLGQIDQRARANCDAPINELKAKRLSDNPTSLFYNKYLSTPFALVVEKISESELNSLHMLAGGGTREVLWSGFYLRAFLDPILAHPITDPFEASVDTDEKIILPGACIVAETLPAPYVVGKNPPPPGGGVSVPGTFGTVSANNGEFRHDTTDMALPGRRMPIVFERVIGGQDLYEGPFGRGWDFNYNQSVIFLKPSLLAPGARIPLIVRKALDSTTAESGDLILNNGEGRTILFKNKGSTPPPELVSDPLVLELDWITLADTFFLPDASEPGVFDLMFRFSDGQFGRLTPDGTQYWYSSGGRIEKIYHRYEKNFQQLVYNNRGELIKIIDKSIDADARFLEIGYYRFATDPELTESGQLDEITDKPFKAGKIARLRDYTERDILFIYSDDGILTERHGPDCNGANGGFSGRAKTIYLWSDPCSGDFQGIVAGDSSGGGTPLFSGSVNGDQALTSGNGAGGSVSFTPPGSNEAESAENSTSSSTGPDGATTDFKFDKFGYTKEINFSGGAPGNATHKTTYNSLGLVEEIVYPEGNSVVFTYDVSNAKFRSRGNLIREERFAGPRGGTPGSMHATYAYDERYNLQAGANTDFNGNSLTYSLAGDGKDVESIDHNGDGTHEFDYDSFGQLKRLKSPDGLVTSYDYNANTGFKARESLGTIQITFAYDSSRAGQLGTPTSVNLPRGANISATYDDRLLLTSMNRGSLSEKHAYDENGNTILIERAIGSKTYRETRKYNQINFLEEVKIIGVETEGGSSDLTTTFTPDAASRIHEVTYPGGEKRTFHYNHLGHVRRMEIGGYNEDYGRDLHGNLTSVSQKGTLTRDIKYDGYDRLTEIRNQVTIGEEVTTLTYHANGERASVIIEDPMFGEVMNTSTPTVDALGRPKKVIRDGSPPAVIDYTYSAGVGGSITMQGPRDGTTTTYDAAGRTRTEVNSLANVTFTPDDSGNIEGISSNEGRTYTMTFTYDDLDHRKSEADGQGPRFTFTPRADGAATSTTDGRSRTTQHDFTVLGEPLSIERPNGVHFKFTYDENRQPAYEGDLGTGHVMTYDDTLRIESKTLRSGDSVEFNDPNTLNLPDTINIPGGTIDMTYDLQGRILGQDVSYGAGEGYRVVYTVDALGRVRTADYGNGGQYSAIYDYNKLGPLKSATYTEALDSFVVATSHYADGSPNVVDYPSGASVSHDRQANSRLNSVSVGGQEIYRVDSYAGAEIPHEVTVGGGAIREINEYDLRKRVRSRRYERGSGGTLLADVRYLYDGADNITARQEVHRHGRTDFYDYDDGNRLTRADTGARPSVPETVRQNRSGLQTGNGLDFGFHARTFTYDGGGLDLLTGCTLSNPNAALLPPAVPFATSLSGHDGYLHAQNVDGFGRTRDPLGNTTRTILQVRDQNGIVGIEATLTYNGLSQLVKVERDDGVTIEYEHQPNGLMHHRKVTRGSAIITDTAFVYDEGRLIEEYEAVGGLRLRASYYYADEDSPIAADIVSGGQTNRLYYLKDALSSVMAVADASGNVVEQVAYDPWGQPLIQGHDTSPPQVSAVLLTNNNELLVVFAELVMPPLSGAGPGIGLVSGTAGLNNAFELQDGTTPVPIIQTTYEEDLDGFPFGSVIRLTVQSVPSGNLVLRVAGGALIDEWGLTNATEEINLIIGGGNPLLYQGPPVGSTAPQSLARSAIGSPFLFHGQYFDYDTGLVYLRNRFYDPYTGVFLQRDPEEYEDSVNLYAGFGHNPTSARDPEGTRLIRLAQTVLRRFGLSSRLAQRQLTGRLEDVIMEGSRRPGFFADKLQKLISQARAAVTAVTQRRAMSKFAKELADESRKKIDEEVEAGIKQNRRVLVSGQDTEDLLLLVRELDSTFARNIDLVQGMTKQNLRQVLKQLSRSGVLVKTMKASPLKLSRINPGRTMRVPNSRGVREIHILKDTVGEALEGGADDLLVLRRELIHELNSRAVLDNLGHETFERLFSKHPAQRTPVFFNKYWDEMAGETTY